jgi:hypothetical protein
MSKRCAPDPGGSRTEKMSAALANICTPASSNARMPTTSPVARGFGVLAAAAGVAPDACALGVAPTAAITVSVGAAGKAGVSVASADGVTAVGGSGVAVASDAELGAWLDVADGSAEGAGDAVEADAVGDATGLGTT